MGGLVQRSGREGTGMGFAEREQTGMDLRVQRSGREGTEMGVAARKLAGMYP